MKPATSSPVSSKAWPATPSCHSWPRALVGGKQIPLASGRNPLAGGSQRKAQTQGSEKPGPPSRGRPGAHSDKSIRLARRGLRPPCRSSNHNSPPPHPQPTLLPVMQPARRMARCWISSVSTRTNRRCQVRQPWHGACLLQASSRTRHVRGVSLRFRRSRDRALSS